MRRALHEEAGPIVATRVLQAAGYEAGEALHVALEATGRQTPGTLGRAEFWRRLADFLRARGWGSLRMEQLHPGIGLLTSSDWAEAADARGETQPSCPFSAGLLSGLLSRTAGGPVAVLQVACTSRGDEACTFAFGSEAAIDALYRRMLDGAGLSTALDRL